MKKHSKIKTMETIPRAKNIDSKRENAVQSRENPIPEKKEKPLLDLKEVTILADAFSDLVNREGSKLIQYRQSFLVHGLNPYIEPMTHIARFYNNFADIALARRIPTK